MLTRRISEETHRQPLLASTCLYAYCFSDDCSLPRDRVHKQISAPSWLHHYWWGLQMPSQRGKKGRQRNSTTDSANSSSKLVRLLHFIQGSPPPRGKNLKNRNRPFNLLKHQTNADTTELWESPSFNISSWSVFQSEVPWNKWHAVEKDNRWKCQSQSTII